MKTWIILGLCVGCLLAPGMMWAQESDDDLFFDDETVVALEEKVDENLVDELNQKSVAFSGEISTYAEYAVTRDNLDGDTDLTENRYTASIDGDFLLDIRLTEGIKSFGDLWLSYSPQTSTDREDDEEEHFDTMLKEFFVDVNMARKVYWRVGKQTLKWGRGIFWNPTDLISADQKDFEDVDARREGVYGLKMHVPFGTTWNVYGFLNASGAETVEELAAAGKVEVLLPKDIEMALSVWKKQGYFAVYGLDFKTYKYSTYWWGEVSVSHGDNRHRLEIRNAPAGPAYGDTQITGDWIPRICVGLSKSFDYGDIPDRVNLNAEFYYNHGGYDENMLEDEHIRAQFLDGGYYERDNYGKYYMALFSSYSEFLDDDMTFHINAIGNLSDSSFIVSSGVEYEFAFDARVRLDVNAYLGQDNREYTMDGKALSTTAEIQLTF